MKQILLILLGSITFANASSLQLPTAFTSLFSQTITTPSKKTIQYNGVVNYNSPSLLKWSYISPTKKEVCTDSKIVLVVDHHLEQVSMFKITKGFNLPAVIKSAKSVGKNEFIASHDNQKFHIRTVNNRQLSQISYIDELDNKVEVNFNNTKYLQSPISNTKLKCNYPSTYDIIEG